jgi:ubiquinone/menaquinone biosynthesis C-methylase UbiE
MDSSAPRQLPIENAEQANLACYDTYYDKPSWWFRLRYDTQIKRRTCLHLIQEAGYTLSHQRVLDIGFGSGATIFSFDTSCEIYGVEASTSALRAAARRAAERGFRRWGFHRASCTALPFGDRQIDVVIASHILEHLEDDEAVVREIMRVLKPDGVAVVLLPINEKHEDLNHVRKYTPDGFRLLVTRCGFSIRVQLENEALFHLVEKFYADGYNKRWQVLGPLIVAAFNVPAALLPFWAHRLLDRLLRGMGMQPRQAGFVLTPTIVRE